MARKQSNQSQTGKILTSYLSPTTQNEFISLLGGIVKKRILTNIKNAKYFSIIFDSTPDISHIDQMSEIIRYIHIENKKIEIKESFLVFFFQLAGKKAVEITKYILNVIERDGLDIKMCRGQEYDNALTMAGVHSGVQARICELNPKALFVPCTNHSLNLCGVHSFATVPSCNTFLGTLESLYLFFSASTHRWAILLTNVEVTVKRLAETRWTKRLSLCLSALQRLSIPLRNCVILRKRSKPEDQLKLCCLQTMLMYFLCLWNNVVQEVNNVEKYLQNLEISLEKSVIKMRNLKVFLKDKIIELFEEAHQFAKDTCEEVGIPVVKRTVRKKIMPGEKVADEPLTFDQELKRSMLECIDVFHQEIETLCKGMECISDRFAVLEPSKMIETSENELPKFVQSLVENYDQLCADGILTEIPRLRRFLKAAKVSKEQSLGWTSLKFLEFVVKYELLDLVPNRSLALRFFLTCVSVTSCERSFSKLKLIKNYLRSTMNQARLSRLAILSIENSVANSIDFDDAISKLAEQKVRKKRF